MDQIFIKDLVARGIVGIVEKVQVRVEKPGALRFSRSVGVEI